MKKFYITTAIDYPNSKPHIGTAFEKIGADVQARFRRQMGYDVTFLMGNDENTLKVDDRAKELSKGTLAYCNEMAAQFCEVWKLLNISNTGFIQTTSWQHRQGVNKFIKTVYDAGYIYKKPYKGLYCTGCEEFKIAKNLVDGKCPNHMHLNIVEREEENYWFKLSEFKRFILDLYFVAPFPSACIEIEPESRLNEMDQWVRAELEDMSISRKNQGWGIPIPWDDSQVIYVWFDALISYLTGIGFGTDAENFSQLWPADVHVIGKDITRFHCALWPAMIAAYNKAPYNQEPKNRIQFPAKVFSHGFINSGGVKVSKSGKSIDPVDIIKDYGADAYRYYFMAKCPFAGDGDFTLEHFKEVYNGDLANNLGNLVSRVYNLLKKYGMTKEGVGRQWIKPEDLDFWIKSNEDFNYRAALQWAWGLLNQANEYLEKSAPWAKTKTDTERQDTLRDMVACLGIVCLLIQPYMPETASKIYNAFVWPIQRLWVGPETIKEIFSDNYCHLGDVRACVEKLSPLFPRKE